MKLPNIFEKDAQRKEAQAGETIFASGAAGDAMYVVEFGEVEIKSEGRVVEKLGPGAFFGEMALLDNQPRSADAVAATDCVLVTITQNQFVFMLQETPFFAIEVMRVMARRLRRGLGRDG